jgi:hypothetical protein
MVLTVISGCAPGAIQVPRFCNPGTAPYQRAVATIHDPYPLNDVGPPVLGGRPPDFKQPLSEVDRARHLNPPRRPLRPLPILEPTVVSQPVVTNPWPAPPPVQTVPAPYPNAPPPVR